MAAIAHHETRPDREWPDLHFNTLNSTKKQTRMNTTNPIPENIHHSRNYFLHHLTVLRH